MSATFRRCLWAAALLGTAAGALGAAGCGAKTGARVHRGADGGVAFDAGRMDAAVPDAFRVDAPPPVDGGPDAFVPPDAGCPPVDDRCGAREACGNGSDDDCDGRVDEGCRCEPGAVQPCFDGPPGRRDVGACVDGAQVCSAGGRWGPCEGGIPPGPDVCNGLDNLCNGCSAREACVIDCPGPGDPRTPDGSPLADYPLDARRFYSGAAMSFRWEVEGGPCDAVSPSFSSFELRGPRRRSAVFHPRLSGDYTVRLRVVDGDGIERSCEWVVHIAGPGLRVEMCYPESDRSDLDLFLKQPGRTTPWYFDASDTLRPRPDQCGWHNCEAMIRGTGPGGGPVTRAAWGYPPSPLSQCVGGPQGDQWRALGFCANPRLDIDNNLAEGTGLPENINVDAPRDGDRFRIMVENWTGDLTHPLVNVYCGGRRVSTLGAPPDEVPRFQGTRGSRGVGAMWRVADVTTRVDPSGATDCTVVPLHPPGGSTGYWVTNGDVSF